MLAAFYIAAKNLKQGAKVFLFSTLLATVDSTFAEDTICTVYNFEVEQTHNYFVGKEGVLVHNVCLRDYLKLKTDAERRAWVSSIWDISDETKVGQVLNPTQRGDLFEELLFNKKFVNTNGWTWTSHDCPMIDYFKQSESIAT